jgi:hypothetical protein
MAIPLGRVEWKRARIWLSCQRDRLIQALLATPTALVLAGLGCMALAASSDLANTFDAPRRGGPVVATLLALTLALAFACFLLATRTALPRLLAHRWRVLRLLIFPILLWAAFTAVQTSVVLIRGTTNALTTRQVRYGSDDLYYNHYNALLVLQGQNPYTGQRLVDVVRYFGERAYTALRRGRFADPRHYPSAAEMDAVLDGYLTGPRTPPPEIDPRTTHSYPAGAFLVNVPAVWAGVPSIAVTQVVLFICLMAAIVVAAPAPWRLIVAVLLLATADGARQVTGSDFEIWPLAGVAAAWLLGERRWASALLLGAACAIKQTAWLAVPFYLVWVWREQGAAEAGRRGAVALAAFLAINLPWLVVSPREWLASLFLPVTLPLLPDGSGIIGLSLTGVLPLVPATIYSLLELAALVGALVWYWQAESRMPFAGLVLPTALLFFAWRSPERYFVLLPLAAVLAAVLTLRASLRMGYHSG